MPMRLPVLCLLLCLPVAGTFAADDTVDVKMMLPELAVEIAQKALLACRKKGYQVAAVVVDRTANVQTVIRDVYASRFNIEIAQRKANATILAGVNSSILRKNREDIRPELNHIDGIIVMEGGVPIVSGGSTLGAIGVSGAPGGDTDEECAQEAIDAVQERLEFLN